MRIRLAHAKRLALDGNSLTSAEGTRAECTAETRRRRVWETVTALKSVLTLGAASTVTEAIATVVLARLGSSTLEARRVSAGETFAALEGVGAGCLSIGKGAIAVIELTRLLFAALEAGSVGVGRAVTAVEVASSAGCVPVCHLT